MKNLILFFTICSVLFFFQKPVISQEISTEVSSQAAQQQYQEGGTQILNYAPVNNAANRIQHSISAPAYSDFLPVGSIPPGERVVWREVKQYLPQQLYSPEEMRKIEERGDFIIQWTGKAFKIEENNDPIRVLENIPVGTNDIELWSVFMETTKNSFVKEDILRMISKIRNKTNTRRVVVTIEVQLNPQVAGNSVGFGGGISGFLGDAASAGGLSPMIGKTESRVYKVYHITVTGYNDGDHVSPVNISRVDNNSLQTRPDIPLAMHLDNNFFLRDPQSVLYNTEWLKRNWKKIEKMNGKINIIGKGFPGNERELKKMALQVKNEIEKILVSQNFVSAQDLKQRIVSGYITRLSSQEMSYIQKEKAKGTIIVQITK